MSVLLPVRAGTLEDQLVGPWIKRLLPEGDLRAYLARTEKLDVPDVIGVPSAFGGEWTSALSLWPDGELPPASSLYVPCCADGVRFALAGRVSALQRGMKLVFCSKRPHGGKRAFAPPFDAAASAPRSPHQSLQRLSAATQG